MPDFIQPFRDRLLDLGCSVCRARRLVRELEDHREDLVQSSVMDGWSAADANARADHQLGDPQLLADKLMASARHATWWGRHAFTGFCLLPLLVFPFIWAGIFFAGLWLDFALGYHLNDAAIHQAADDPVAFHRGLIFFHSMDLLSIALVTMLFCWLGHRSAVNLRWLFLTCFICCLYASFSWVHIQPHSISAGFRLAPTWHRTFVPLVVAGAAYFFHWRSVQKFRQANA